MTTTRVIDIESLLQPVREDAPAGSDLREDRSPTSPYYQIKDARNGARAAERSALRSDDPHTAPVADWSPVLELAPQLLREVSKDLEIAAWYIEALVRTEGFPGMRDGLEVVRELFTRFGDGLYPMPDEDGIETRVAPLTGLNGQDAEGTLLAPIIMVPLLEDDEGSLSAWQYRSARELAAVADPEAKQARIDAGAVTLDRFHAAVQSSEPAELFAVRQGVEECLQEFDALAQVMTEKCGNDAPPTSNIRNALQDVLDCMAYLTKDLVVPTEEEEVQEAAAEAEGGGAAPVRSAPPGTISTRSDALEVLAKVAEFFRKTEPHSPVSYSVDQSLRWARMPLHQLVSELIPDQNALAEFKLRTGMPSIASADQNEPVE